MSLLTPRSEMTGHDNFQLTNGSVLSVYCMLSCLPYEKVNTEIHANIKMDLRKNCQSSIVNVLSVNFSVDL